VGFDHCACSGNSLARLVRPAVLALLAGQGSYGYELDRRLSEVAFFRNAPPDTSGVYKVLKAMEREGILRSSWQSGDEGPRRRRYSLTDKGDACLKQWIETLEDYRGQIDGLLRLVQRNCPTGPPNPRAGE
jgi:DNA-binding PadR family transcriptional regulator